MLNVKQSYIIAKNLSPNLYLISILNFDEDFGFLFSKKKNESMTFVDFASLGDLKAENLLLDSEGNLKVAGKTDFSL